MKIRRKAGIQKAEQTINGGRERLQKLRETEKAILDYIERTRAAPIQEIVTIFFEGRERTGYRTIERLRKAGFLIVRRRTRLRLNLRKYAVLGKEGRKVLGQYSRNTLTYYDPKQAERILLGREVRTKLTELGVKEARFVDRPDALRLLNLPERRAALDWLVATEQGYHSVHVRSSHNAKTLWNSVRNTAKHSRVVAHTIVCLDPDLASAERRRYREAGSHPVVDHYYVVSWDDEDDWRTLAEIIEQPLAWVREVALRFKAVLGCEAVVQTLPEHELFRLRLTCGARSWVMGDARLWDTGLLWRVATANIDRLGRDLGVEGIALLTRDLRDARNRAIWTGWRDGVWWVLLTRSPEKSVFCSREGQLVPYTLVDSA